MRHIILTLLAFSATLLIFLSGCMPSSTSGSVYSRDQAQTSQSVYYGTIQRVEAVTIEGTQSGVGALGGAALGGVLGSALGGGSGRDILIVGGALAGAAAGSVAEKSATTAQGVELEVELDNGELLLVVQEADADYRIGDRVRVVKDSKGATRVRQ